MFNIILFLAGNTIVDSNGDYKTYQVLAGPANSGKAVQQLVFEGVITNSLWQLVLQWELINGNLNNSPNERVIIISGTHGCEKGKSLFTGDKSYVIKDDTADILQNFLTLSSKC